MSPCDVFIPYGQPGIQCPCIKPPMPTQEKVGEIVDTRQETWEVFSSKDLKDGKNYTTVAIIPKIKDPTDLYEVSWYASANGFPIKLTDEFVAAMEAHRKSYDTYEKY